MKKDKTITQDELRPEYDLKSLQVRKWELNANSLADLLSNWNLMLLKYFRTLHLSTRHSGFLFGSLKKAA